MNFLNPFVLLGLAAAGIPVLLHLLNLRRLRTVDFSTLRFLQELQQTRVRRLKVQQILLLVLRTLVVLFAVFAFARPTVPSRLPLLGIEARSSVVVLVDNSASMQAADPRGERFRQAQAAARSVIDGLRDGDEVAVVPLAGYDPGRSVVFTRTHAAALEAVERMRTVRDEANLPQALRLARGLFDEAQHAQHTVVVVSDAQRSLVDREQGDSGTILRNDATVLLARVGDGRTGLELNCSVDSVHLVTRLLQPDRPVEVEAWIRNGSDEPVTGLVVSMSFDGVRVAQRALDLPAGEQRAIVLAAPPQRRGAVAVSIDIDNDAIDGDNVAWLGITIPPRPRVAVIGSPERSRFVRLALGVPGLEGSLPEYVAAETFSSVAASLSSFDVVMFCDGVVTAQDGPLIRQYLERGGNVVAFASERPEANELVRTLGLVPQEMVETATPITVTSTDQRHPLYAGVFRSTDEAAARSDEAVRLDRIRPAGGGTDIVRTTAGALLTETVVGRGRVVYCAVAPIPAWGSFPTSGLFPTTVIRSVLYCTMPRDEARTIALGAREQVAIPARYAGRTDLVLRDAAGLTTPVPVVDGGAGPTVMLPARYETGVIKIMTSDSIGIAALAINAPVRESRLDYLDPASWKGAVQGMVVVPDHVETIEATSSMAERIAAAQLGSELWPLCIVLALACALAEMAVARFWASEGVASEAAGA